MTTSRTLYLVVTGASSPEPVTGLAALLRDCGWDLTVISTEMGARFHDLDALADISGRPVRIEFRRPGTGERMLPADVVVACPLSFNSTNKLAQGLADTMALALLCEMVGHGVPTIVAPKASAGLQKHPAFGNSLAVLRELPNVTVLHDPTPERPLPAWRQIAEAAEQAIAQ